MTYNVRRLKATGIHGQFDLELDFEGGLTIVYGRNGSGKTTLLHILTNALNLDIERFAYLNFHNVEVHLEDGHTIRLERRTHHNDRDTITAWVNDDRLGPVKVDELIEGPPARMRARYRDIQEQKEKLSLQAQAIYFPAFRTMIEAWASVVDEEQFRHVRRSMSEREFELRYNLLGDEYYRSITTRKGSTGTAATLLARKLFGEFVPLLDYPSLNEIEQSLNGEIQNAIYQIASIDQVLLADAFVEAFNAISEAPSTEVHEKPDQILANIEQLSEELQDSPLQSDLRMKESVYGRLREQLASFRLDTESQEAASRVLAVYERSLRRRQEEQTKAFASIQAYVESVNQFLERKSLVVEARGPRERPQVGIKFGDGRLGGLQTLSSGERQIFGLIYAASHIRKGNIVLIDEPEISLHIDWQQDLIGAMVEQLPAKQLIVCTHSPVIGAEYQSKMKELIPIQTEYSAPGAHHGLPLFPNETELPSNDVEEVE